MSSQRYPEEFRIEAAKQILEHGHSVADVSRRLGVSSHSLYKWVRQQQIPVAQRTQQVSQSEELRRLKAELKRVTEERQVVGWSTGSRIDTQLALDALHMAVWRRRPRDMVVVHSDQGCQFTSHEWQRFGLDCP